MGLDRAMNISVSAIEAEQKRMEVISSNIANINTTRSEDGGPYRRLEAVFNETPYSFDEALSRAEQKLSGGVDVSVVEDSTPFKKVYNPSHPDSDKEGFVLLPNVELAKEMVDLVGSSKVHEANITAYNASKKMKQDALSIQ